jgi:hypothetical protein
MMVSLFVPAETKIWVHGIAEGAKRRVFRLLVFQ